MADSKLLAYPLCAMAEATSLILVLTHSLNCRSSINMFMTLSVIFSSFCSSIAVLKSRICTIFTIGVRITGAGNLI